LLSDFLLSTPILSGGEMGNVNPMGGSGGLGGP